MDRGMDTESLMAAALEEARRAAAEGEVPIGAVVALGGAIVGRGFNHPIGSGDPTAHAEILAIREACKKLGTEHLTDCTIYILASPCPMCLGSLYYCSPKRVIYITTRDDYAPFYKDDRKYFELETFYDEFAKPIGARRLPMVQENDEGAIKVYQRWQALNKK